MAARSSLQVELYLLRPLFTTKRFVRLTAIRVSCCGRRTCRIPGLATPVTYMVDGKQYVVIATGGGKDPKSPSGGEYVAFALP